MNAEEIMDWEEKVYDLQQEIRERDAESLDQLSDSVIDALENRYQAMLEDANRQLREQLDKVSALQAQLQARAHRDALTGLYNRHYLHETLPDLLAQARQARHGLALVMVEVL